MILVSIIQPWVALPRAYFKGFQLVGHIGGEKIEVTEGEKF